MAKFSSAPKQAASVMKQLQGTHIKSVGTVRNYEQALTRVATFLKENKLGTLRQLDTQSAAQYLEIRGQEVNQKTLDMERQAIQSMMQNVTCQLMPGTTLVRTQSELTQSLNSRFYEPVQAYMVANAQTVANSMATQIALTTGIRAHELYTLRRAEERPADIRPTHEGKFVGRDGVRYTVIGKGGLTREILMPHSLATKLETLRHNTAMKITDRTIHYRTHYGIGGGQRWSNSFSAASSRTLGWSRGAHGLRHTYAQQRMHELQALGYVRNEALLVVSQELGHFRPAITEVYLK